jgi:hypothetical protein
MSASSVGAAAGFVAGGPIGALFGFQAGMSKEALDETKKARQSAEKLEAQRRKELADQAAAREAAAARAATSGQRVGMRAGLVDAVGFGTGNTNSGVGAGRLFGN